MTTKTAETEKNKLTNTRKRLHPNCVVCSRSNTQGLQLDFSLCENGGVAADFEFDETLEGYPGVPHGGVISSVFDGAMGNCLFAQGCTPVTAELNIRFRPYCHAQVRNGQGTNCQVFKLSLCIRS